MEIYHKGYLISKGEGRSLYYLDQLNEKESWIYYTYFTTHLLKKYNLSAESYFKLITKDILSDEDKLCPFCKVKEREFSGRLSGGYGYHCGSKECSDRCYSDKQSRISISHWMHPSEEFLNNRRRSIQNDWDSLTPEQKSLRCKPLYTAGNSPEVIRYCTFQREITRSLNNPYAYFYIAKSKGLFKFGITSTPEERSTSYNSNYDKMKIILEGDRLKMAKLEYLIKCKLNIHYEHISWELVGNFRKAFLESLKEI